MTTPLQRLTRMLAEDARFTAYMPGNLIIDVTDDIEAAMAQVQTAREGFESVTEDKESIA
jgi:hypothetical protein